MPDIVAETTPGRSDRTARILTATRLYLISPPEAPKYWGQINPNLNNYHSDPMDMSSRFWIPEISDWWRQQEETDSKYTKLCNVARDIFSIKQHGVGVEASFFSWPRYYRLEAVKDHTGDPSRKSRGKEVCSSQ
jgi:hypothetical protein